ncbi:MAG: spore coat U domain-containing protein [Alphaproteobacteria bacterium]|nr:spore coat U domain-containing protein [Alphaproteobacteria bacterium]
MRLKTCCMVMAALWLLMAGGAQAQVCNFAMTNINFGNINIGPGGTPSTTGTLTANCSGIANRTITICPNIGDGTGGSASGSPRYLLNGANTISYDLLQPNGQVWGSFVWPYAARAPILSLTLNGQGTGSLSQTVQAVISGSIASAPTGTYLSTYSAYHTLFDYGYAPGQNCSVVSTRATQAPFAVQAANVATCNLSTTAMDFGTLSGLTTAQAATSQIGITCTKGAAYVVSLSNGSNGGTGPTARKMAGAGGSISYGIYRDAAHAQPWGQTTGTDTVSGIGTGLAQTVTAYGFLPAQGNPNPATYSDVVVVTVSY